MNKIRVTQVGVGGRGRVFVNALKARDDFVPVAYVDVSEEAIEAARKTSPLPREQCFADMAKALDKVKCDAIFVITPPPLHAGQCLMALDQGKHVLVEKPFAKSLAKAEQVVEKAQEKSLRVVVSQNVRYNATIMKVRELIEKETYGKVCAGTVCKSGFRAGVHNSAEDEHAYLWERGVHDIDTLLYLTHPRKPARLSARSFNPPFSPYKGGAGCYGWIEFDDGSVFSLNLSFMAHSKRNEYAIECEQACIVINPQITIHRAKAEPELVAVDDAQYKDAVAHILDDFHEYITSGKEPLISGRNNLSTVRLVETLGKSSEENAVVEL